MSAPSRGLFASTRSLLSTTLELVRVRVELLANDAELGVLRLFDAILLALLSVLAIGIGVVLLCGFVLLLVQEAWRLHALGAMALVFLGGGAWALMAARASLRRAGWAFDATRAELARDLAALTPRD